jgi:hypothetical protein
LNTCARNLDVDRQIQQASGREDRSKLLELVVQARWSKATSTRLAQIKASRSTNADAVEGLEVPDLVAIGDR